MKSRYTLGFLLILTLAIGCASGDLEGQPNQEQSDAGDANAQNHPNGQDDAGLDTWSPDIGDPDTGPSDPDTGPSDPDAGPSDPDTGPSDPDTGPSDPCDGVTCPDAHCEPTTGDCVECLSNSHCDAELTCSPDNTCLGCTSDADCEGNCHDQYPICIAPCCDPFAEDAFTSVSYIHDRIDIGVMSDGTPMILFGDTGNDKLRLAQRVGNVWLSQDIADISGSTGNHMRLEIHDDQPHVVYRRFNRWEYHWRSSAGWHMEEVWHEDLSSGYTDLVVEDDGTAHFIAEAWDSDAEHEVHYAQRAPNGTWTRESFALDGGKNVIWLALDAKSDGTIVASLTTYDVDDQTWQIYIAERPPAGVWSEELVVPLSFQVHHMAVGPDDEIQIVYIHPGGTPHTGLWLTRGQPGSWTTENVHPTATDAGSVYMDIDHLGDPHISYNRDSAYTLGYTRWDGNDWEHNEYDDSSGLIERSFWQRIAVDHNRAAHIVVYDSTANTITYVKME